MDRRKTDQSCVMLQKHFAFPSNSRRQVQNVIFCVNFRSAMFCTHLSHNWQAVQLLPGWDLFCARHGQPIAHSHCFEHYTWHNRKVQSNRGQQKDSYWKEARTVQVQPS